jgi:hypothetical protein
MTSNATMTDSSTTTWNAQFAALKTRFPHVRDAILVALHILSQNPDVSDDDAKAQAALLGTRITAASIAGARRLMDKQDTRPAAAPAAATPAAPARVRRPRATDAGVDAEALIRGLVGKLQGQGAADTERLKDAMRKAIAVLQAAVE